MRGFHRRGLRLELVAGLGIALAMSALSLAAQNVSTQTTLTAETHDQSGRTQAKFAVTVNSADGAPAKGVVVIKDGGAAVSGAALNPQGQATTVIDLPAGNHSLTATYSGDAVHRSSTSMAAEVQAQTSSTPNFQIAIAPATLSLTAGNTGTVVATVTPVNSSSLTAPMFITLSCSGLPDQSSCSFTPENVEILPNATVPVTSSMYILTQAQGTASVVPHQSNPISWAFLLPGALGLGGIAWASRRSPRRNRLSLLALVAVITALGTTGCNPRYNYEHHGPVVNPPTPPGTYTVTVTAQSSDGITAITNSTSLALTVQ